MTNWEWLLNLSKERPDELAAWLHAERGGVVDATEHVRDATKTMPDSREKLEADVLNHVGLVTNRDTVFEWLDRQAEITRRTEQAEWIKQANGLIHEANARADELKAERDEAVEAYDAHMAAHDAWHEAEDITYTRNRFTVYEQATKERIARIEAERDALQAENMSLKANSDECVPKAIKKRDEVIKILESERDEARAKCAELEAEANGLVGQIGDVEGSLLIEQRKNRELREKLSQAIGHAVDILALQDLTAVDAEGEAVA